MVFTVGNVFIGAIGGYLGYTYFGRKRSLIELYTTLRFWFSLLLTFLILVFGEITPKTYCNANSTKIALRFAPVLLAFSYVFYPVVKFFEIITKGVVKMTGSSNEPPPITEEEIKGVIDQGLEEKALEKEEMELVHGALKFDDTVIRSVMTPRTKMFTLNSKMLLFEALPKEGHAYLNADPQHCEELMRLAECPVQTVGTGGHATFEAFDIQETQAGVSFTLRGIQFSVPLQGTHQVTNVLLAVAVAEVLGIPHVESAKRLQTFEGPPQTFEKKEGAKGQVVLDDTHNASPESFRAAIEWARTSSMQRKVLVTSGLCLCCQGSDGV